MWSVVACLALTCICALRVAAGRKVTEQYLGKPFQEFVPMPTWEYKDYLGWGEQGDGKLFYGIYVQVGRNGRGLQGDITPVQLGYCRVGSTGGVRIGRVRQRAVTATVLERNRRELPVK